MYGRQIEQRWKVPEQVPDQPKEKALQGNLAKAQHCREKNQKLKIKYQIYKAKFKNFKAFCIFICNFDIYILIFELFYVLRFLRKANLPRLILILFDADFAER